MSEPIALISFEPIDLEQFRTFLVKFGCRKSADEEYVLERGDGYLFIESNAGRLAGSLEEFIAVTKEMERPKSLNTPHFCSTVTVNRGSASNALALELASAFLQRWPGCAYDYRENFFDLDSLEDRRRRHVGILS